MMCPWCANTKTIVSGTITQKIRVIRLRVCDKCEFVFITEETKKEYTKGQNE